MTTGIAVAVLTFLAMSIAVAAVVVLRLVPSAGPTLRETSSEEDPSLHSSLPSAFEQNNSTQTHPTLVPPPPDDRAEPVEDGPTAATVRMEETPALSGREYDASRYDGTSPPEGAPAYDPALENEDDVPTTLFRNEDSEELVAFIADLENESKER